MSDKLKKLSDAFETWCMEHKCPYDIVIDEDDLQGYLIFNRQARFIPSLINHLMPIVNTENIHIKPHNTRAGVVLAFSLKALSENQLERILSSNQPTYADKVERALNGELSEQELAPRDPISKPKEKPKTNPTARTPSKFPEPVSTGGEKPTGQRQEIRPTAFGQRIHEALDGVGAHFQPVDVINNLRRAVVRLGLQDKLEAANIGARISDDGLYLHFYSGGEGKPDLELKRYFLQDLADENKLADALRELADIAGGRAPGAGKLEDEVRRKEEQGLQKVAKRYAVANVDDDSPELTRESFDDRLKTALSD